MLYAMPLFQFPPSVWLSACHSISDSGSLQFGSCVQKIRRLGDRWSGREFYIMDLEIWNDEICW